MTEKIFRIISKKIWDSKQVKNALGDYQMMHYDIEVEEITESAFLERIKELDEVISKWLQWKKDIKLGDQAPQDEYKQKPKRPELPEKYICSNYCQDIWHKKINQLIDFVKYLDEKLKERE